MADAPLQNDGSILQFSHLTTEPDLAYDGALRDVSFELAGGELMLVCVPPHQPRSPIADAAQGLIDPASGSVRFLGEDWNQMSAYRVAEMRGHIGRVFFEGGWISNLDVDENITLAQRHHTLRSPADIEREATELARAFGMEGVPHGRPAAVRRDELRRAALVRAFLGSPRLVILENPVAGLDAQVFDATIEACRRARSGGAAVLWLSTDSRIWGDARLDACQRLNLDDLSTGIARTAR